MIKYNVQSPHIQNLSRFVDSYVEITGKKDISKTITPRLNTTLTFDLNNNSLYNGYKFNANVIGHHNAPFHLSTRSENQRKVIVQFKAYGLSPFLKTPVSSLNNRVVDAKKIFGHEIRSLYHSLQTAPTPEKRIQLIENFLVKRFQAPSPSHISIYQLADKLINTHRTYVDVLKDEIPLSTRQIERNFKNLTGLTISQFIKIHRFEKARKLMARSNVETKKLTDIAYQAGYYDQSHFNSDFKKFSGVNPLKYQSC